MNLQVGLLAYQPAVGQPAVGGDGDYLVCQGCRGSGLARNGKPIPANQQFGLDLVPGDTWDLFMGGMGGGGLYVTSLRIAGTD